MSEWISVEDRLPDIGSNVIACTQRLTINEEALITVGEYEYSLTGRWLGYYYQGVDYLSEEEEIVTHWMPLPEPPNAS